MPIVRGDGNKAKSAIYDWEREVCRSRWCSDCLLLQTPVCLYHPPLTSNTPSYKRHTRTQSRNDQSAIKEYLDQEWQKKMRKKRDSDAGKSLRSAAKTGDAEAVRYVNTDRGGGERFVRVRACVRMCERK